MSQQSQKRGRNSTSFSSLLSSLCKNHFFIDLISLCLPLLGIGNGNGWHGKNRFPTVFLLLCVCLDGITHRRHFDFCVYYFAAFSMRVKFSRGISQSREASTMKLTLMQLVELETHFVRRNSQDLVGRDLKSSQSEANSFSHLPQIKVHHLKSSLSILQSPFVAFRKKICICKNNSCESTLTLNQRASRECAACIPR